MIIPAVTFFAYNRPMGIPMSRPEHNDEQEIIRRCLDGDRDAYAVLVDRYRSMAYTIAFRMTGDADTANDLAQEGFIAAYTNLRTFRFGSRFSTWLCSIVMNRCRDRLRTEKEQVPVDDLDALRAPAASDPERSASQSETGVLLQRALDRLQPEYREVLVLKHIEGRDYREISGILGVSVGALKVRAHRGRELLKGLLEQAGATP
jgi:RNA polymerase sigma-70 factor (ECF subfamily)